MSDSYDICLASGWKPTIIYDPALRSCVRDNLARGSKSLHTSKQNRTEQADDGSGRFHANYSTRKICQCEEPEARRILGRALVRHLAGFERGARILQGTAGAMIIIIAGYALWTTL